ncbi:MAG TPA: MoaD/ThiS family protein [Alphaproteobacteria bacterium]|nr:MoaD/ThiS family protein [Alphaproteobacteria bacterium]
MGEAVTPDAVAVETAVPRRSGTIRITLKLYATLTKYLPPEARKEHAMEMDVGEAATIAGIIEPLNMPPKLVHLVLVNGFFVPPAERATKRFVDGDVLAIWPPIAGG